MKQFGNASQRRVRNPGAGHPLVWFPVLMTLVLLFLAGTTLSGCSCSRDVPEEEVEEEWTFEIASNDLLDLDELDPDKPELPPQVGGIEIPEDIDQLPRIENETTDELPSRFDWRDEGVVAPIREQACGDCWAFAACAVAESVYAIENGELPDISEQWLIDCNTNGWGCVGGEPAFSYFVDKPDRCGQVGAVLEESVPYQGYEADCKCDVVRLAPLAYWGVVSTYANPASIEAVKRTIKEHGPVWAGLEADWTFVAYQKDIYNLHNSPQHFEPHAVVITGWDDGQGAEGIWFVRNSWGTSWGEAGTARVEYGARGLGERLVVCLTNKPVSSQGSDGGGEEGGGEEGGGEEGGGEEGGGEEGGGEEGGGEEGGGEEGGGEEGGGEEGGGEEGGGEEGGGEEGGGEEGGGEEGGGEEGGGELAPPENQNGPPLSPGEAAARARQLLERANQAAKRGDIEGAFREALKAWQLVHPHAQTDEACGQLAKELQRLLQRLAPKLKKGGSVPDKPFRIN